MSEEVQSATGMFSGETYQRRVTKIVIAVLFDGEKDVFRLSASQFSFNPARVEVREGSCA